jgi:hypothetical protein
MLRCTAVIEELRKIGTQFSNTSLFLSIAMIESNIVGEYLAYPAPTLTVEDAGEIAKGIQD